MKTLTTNPSVRRNTAKSPAQKRHRLVRSAFAPQTAHPHEHLTNLELADQLATIAAKCSDVGQFSLVAEARRRMRARFARV